MDHGVGKAHNPSYIATEITISFLEEFLARKPWKIPGKDLYICIQKLFIAKIV